MKAPYPVTALVSLPCQPLRLPTYFCSLRNSSRSWGLPDRMETLPSAHLSVSAGARAGTSTGLSS